MLSYIHVWRGMGMKLLYEEACCDCIYFYDTSRLIKKKTLYPFMGKNDERDAFEGVIKRNVWSSCLQIVATCSPWREQLNKNGQLKVPCALAKEESDAEN